MDDEVRRNLERGREAYRDGRHDEAEPLLVAVADEAGFADVHHMLGVIYLSRRRFEPAIAQFERALELNPRYSEAAINLTLTYNEAGRYEDARRVQERARLRGEDEKPIVDPHVRGRLANMHADLGDAYREAGLYEEAARELRHALQLCPGFADLRTRLAVVYREAGRLDEAARELEKVKRAQPRYLPGLLNLGLARYLAGDREAARAEWDAALAIDPESALARAYLRMLS